MSAKHTPGPWTAHDRFVSRASSEAGWICEVGPFPIDDADQRSANARLIAAAPEMLEALFLIAGMESSARPNHMGSIAMLDAECRAGSIRDHARMQVIARAAIAKATGAA